MIKLRKLPYEQLYKDFKNSFTDGIECKRASVDFYLKNRTADFEAGKESLEKIAEDLYINKNGNMYNLLNRVKTIDADWNAINNTIFSDNVRDKIFSKGKSKVENAFIRGMRNPDVCLMAFYDAVAEWALNTASKHAGKQAPVKVIEKEVSQISSQIFKDENNRDAYNKLLKQFKKMNPKTGKKRLKIIQKSYLLKIESGINEILRTMITPKN